MTAMMFYIFLVHIVMYSRVINYSDIIYACKFVVIINALFFIIQFVSYYSIGYFFDFNNYVREEYSNTMYTARGLANSIFVMRATGLYSEPSFYAMSIFPVSLIVTILDKKIGKTFILSGVTCLLSLSVASLIIVALSSLVLIDKLQKSKIAFLIAFAFFCIFLPDIYDFAISRIINQEDYDAIGSRMLILDEFRFRSLAQDIFGSGFFWYEHQPIGRTGLSGANIRDSSFFIYTYFSAGIVGVVLLALFITFYLPANLKIKYAVMISLLFKYGFLNSSLWFILIPVLALKYSFLEETEPKPELSSSNNQSVVR